MDHHAATEHCHEVRCFLSLNNANLHWSSAHPCVHLNCFCRSSSLLISRRFPSLPDVDNVTFTEAVPVSVQNNVA